MPSFSAATTYAVKRSLLPWTLLLVPVSEAASAWLTRTSVADVESV